MGALVRFSEQYFHLSVFHQYTWPHTFFFSQRTNHVLHTNTISAAQCFNPGPTSMKAELHL